MKAIFLALASAAFLPALALRAQTPYVETTTLTFYWGFSSSYISGTNTPIPSLPEDSIFDPDGLPVGFETYTDTLRPRAYTGPVAGTFSPAGANRQIIELLLQRMVRNGLIEKEALAYRWQLTAVREAPANVQELATNPYRVFLTGQAGNSTYAYPVVETVAYGSEAITDDPLPPLYLDTDTSTPEVTVDTGLTLTLGGFSGNYTETNWGEANNKVRSASGSVSTAFTIDFGAVFYEDPKHAVDKPQTTPTFNYHLKRHYWQASASGLISYGIRSISGPLPTFVASTAKATGTGWFRHERDEVEYKDNVPVLVLSPTKTYSGNGLAPLKVTMSTIQYQKRNRFLLSIPDSPSGLVAEAVASVDGDRVDLTWADSFNETHLLLERQIGLGAWAEIARLEANVTRYRDLSVSAATTYTYRIRAANGGGLSDYSNEASVTTPEAP